MKDLGQLVKVPVNLILMRRLESSPGLWCCTGFWNWEDHSEQEEHFGLGRVNALPGQVPLSSVSCRELYQLIKIET